MIVPELDPCTWVWSSPESSAAPWNSRIFDTVISEKNKGQKMFPALYCTSYFGIPNMDAPLQNDNGGGQFGNCGA